ncbi:COP9 signalosome complex subunit 4 [Aphelenchoides bicaudatus]|nr:COP9 signalosome complex subunit 4 [Aphelenchoides bicaudatus]
MSIESQIQQAQTLEAGGDLEGAAQILLALSFEGAQRPCTDILKMETYLKSAELCIRLGKIDEAEAQINRASMLQTTVTDANLLQQYKSLYAIILDHNQRFAEAATRYFEISNKSQLSPEEKARVLQSAIVCTILAIRGQQKSQMLTNLYKDERCHSLIGYPIIEEMHFERFIKPEQLKEFETILKPHQQKQVENSEASTLQQATIEHNIMSLARIYKNITFERLGELLHIPADALEETVARIISSNQLRATIDQIDRVIIFEDNNLTESYINNVLGSVNLNLINA